MYCSVVTNVQSLLMCKNCMIFFIATFMFVAVSFLVNVAINTKIVFNHIENNDV